MVLPVALLIGGCGSESDETTQNAQTEPLETVAESVPTTPPAAPQTVNEKDYKVIEGGLKIYDLKAGTGKEATRGAKVTVHYSGWLTNGTLFDSSLKRGPGKPFDFRVETGSVIKGWHLGVAGMKEGGARQLVIPPELAYGKRSTGKIPADSTLIFEVHLLKVGDVRLPPEAMPVAETWTGGTDGLKYSDLTVGSGAEIVKGSAVEAEATVWLENGDLVFSSYQADKGITFSQGMGRILPGWDIGSLGMKTGGVRLLKIPANLAFGEKGRGKIGPNATIHAQLEVKKVGEPRIPPNKAPKFQVEDMTANPSGLQILDLVKGSGGAPKKGQNVSVEYTGWLEDGTMFDSSYKGPQALQFSLGHGRVIKGWDEGIASMQIGGKRILRIPPNIAYGERGSPPVIPPNSTLIFQVELVDAK